MRSKNPSIRLVLATASLASAIQAPVCPAWRSLGMGGAGIAIVDDIDAVHLNPAGLTQMGKKGTFKPLDTLGYKRDRFDLRLISVGVDPGVDDLMDIYHFWNDYKSTIRSATAQDSAVKLVENQKMLNDLYEFDRRSLPVTTLVETGFAIRNLGVSAWGSGTATLMLDHGAITPKATMQTQSTVAVELATAQSFLDDRLSLGFGYRVAAVTSQSREYDVLELDSVGADAPLHLLSNSGSDLRRSQDWGHGFDLGVLWFQTPGLRFGGSIRDVGMKLDDKFVTPNLSLGAAWAPKVLQNNRWWWRRVNLAISLDDILYDTLGYKPLSKIDVGVECTQVLIPYVVTVGVSGGFKGGYPTMLLSTTLFSAIQADLLTYAEETGFFTGDRENRVWMARVGVGL